MKVLIADKFEKVGIDGLKELGCEVVAQPDVKAEGLAALIRENKADEAMSLHLNEGYPQYREIATLVTRAVRNEEAEMGRLREGL